MLMALSSFAMSDGHTLTGLWEKYEKARKADRPVTEAEILSQIKQEALRQHLPVDFYDAATKYVSTVQRRDWKQADALRTKLKAEVEEFDDPFITYLWMDEWKGASGRELWKYVQAHPGGFAGSHPALYHGAGAILSGAYKPFIKSDAEYVLWDILQQDKSVESEVSASLGAMLDGSYPGEGALQYYLLDRTYYSKDRRGEKKAALQSIAERYAGKALALFPEGDLLEMEKYDLDEGNAGEAEYRALGARCRDFEKRREAFRGDEALLAKACNQGKDLLGRLENKSLDIEADDNKSVKVIFQNLADAKVTLRRDGRSIRTWNAVNKAGSYYLRDTVSIALDPLPDGSYTIEAVSGKISAEETLEQYTLSIATRTDANGRSVYVADYKTGEPLRNVTLRLLKGDKELAKSALSLHGFTKLPAAFDKHISDNAYYTVEASEGNRKSRAVTTEWAFRDRYSDASERCNIYKDRGAYNPGDTLNFKAVVYKGDPMLGLEVCAGKKITVIIKDSEGKELESRTLTTNEWGSASSSFVIPKGQRGGMFGLEVKGLAYDSFRVDEFVLPSFTLSFDSLDKLYLVGDSIPVTGKVTSYSGHSLSGAAVSIDVERYGSSVYANAGEVAPDNTFAFEFPAKVSGFYFATVKVTDQTGETLTFSRGYYVGENLQVRSTVEGEVDARLQLSVPDDGNWRRRTNSCVIEDPNLSVRLETLDDQGNVVPVPVSYRLKDKDGKTLSEGKVESGGYFKFALPSDGLYTLETRSFEETPDGRRAEGTGKDNIVLSRPSSATVPSGVKRFFIPGESEVSGGISARLGGTQGKIYSVVTLYGEGRTVLHSSILNIESGKIATISLPYLDSYPDAVRLQVFYFIDGEAVTYDNLYRRAKDKYSLPLSFTRFHDKAFPGTQYSFELKTAPGVEALVAAWDKSMDAIARNNWNTVSMREYSVENVNVRSACGSIVAGGGYGPIFYSRKTKGGVLGAANVAMVETAAPVLMEEVSLEMADSALEPGSSSPDGGVEARTDFSTALTFQPQLYPSAEGTLKFSFTTSDKLSTFYVRVYAHDKAMHNAMVQDEMVVSIPVKVSLLEPRFLYEGDKYEAVVTVSSIADEAVSGTMVLSSGENVQQVPVKVAPGEVVSKTFAVIPGSGPLTLKASFVASDFTDAVEVTVPVQPAAQVLTEAHSAVLRDGMSREALLRDLRSRFVNVPASQASVREITVLDMVKDAIPSHVVPSGKDVLSLSEAWYTGLMASRLSVNVEVSSEELLGKIMDCQNGDGGFAWFEGMPSNAIITAVVLERFAKLRDRGFIVPDVASAVKYLDSVQFDTAFPHWRGWVSDAQYMRVRSMYASVPFDAKIVSETQKKRMKEFQKDAKSYLVPSAKEGRGLEGQILAKARRLLTLRNLDASAEGRSLAKAWGVSLATSSKLQSSIKADVISLLEYAVEHRDGGWYYPNAVMPWRGLLESEAYAHALLCDLLSSDSPSVADGVRLWLMLQKETQKWDAEPAFVDAITAILDGSEAVLNTRVMALSATYEAPFKDIKAAGNGFTVSREFFRNGVELKPGDEVSVGDVISAKYVIWNAENRSFVKVTAGREASLQPVQQLSGHTGWGFIRPLRGGYSWSFTPSGYRNVKASSTEYYFDSYPEEKTTLEEEFYVVRAGRFQAPVTVIESLYAPHYRANSAYRQPLVSLVTE